MNPEIYNHPSCIFKKFTSWKPEPLYLFLLPSRTEDRQGGIILPESYTKKNNSGVCFACGHANLANEYLDKECFFPNNQEYRVEDSDTGYLFYIVPHDKIIMTRIPPPEILRLSQAKVEGLAFKTIEHSKKN